jgi:type II secretory pathway component GspD/PulD (secretin)
LKSLEGSSLTVTYFPQKGTINITGGSDAQAEMIKKFIIANDTKQPQAYVEVQVVDLTEDGAKQFNNEWTLLTPFISAQFGADGHTKHFLNRRTFFAGGPYTIDTVSGSGEETKVVSSYYGRDHGHTVAWAIDYLIQNRKGRLLANPKVVVTNGKKSVIKLTQDYVKKITEDMQNNTLSANGPVVTREYEISDDMGIIIEMTPFISPDGHITMNLKPSYSTEAGAEMAESPVSGPYRAATLLKRRSLDLSNIRIKDGETLVLGGMVQEEEQKTVQKIPFLGDLPVVGGLFKNTNTKNVKSELVIMVTPRIIKDTEDALADADNL